MEIKVFPLYTYSHPILPHIIGPKQNLILRSENPSYPRSLPENSSAHTKINLIIWDNSQTFKIGSKYYI